MNMGFTPPADLMQELPDDIPVELGINAWQAGVRDGMNDLQPFSFPEFKELQPLYDSGYATGDLSRRIARVIDARPGGTPTQPEEAKEQVAKIPHLLNMAIHAVTGPIAVRLALWFLIGLLMGLLLFAVTDGVVPWR